MHTKQRISAEQITILTILLVDFHHWVSSWAFQVIDSVSDLEKLIQQCLDSLFVTYLVFLQILALRVPDLRIFPEGIRA